MNDKQPLVSVIVPVYNVERFLPQCLDSILCQTWNHFELLLIDDGSTDGSSDICQTYARKDSRIRLHKQVNQGLSVARNVGIANAQGDYLTFVDSDDIIHTNYLCCMLGSMLQWNLDMICCGYICFKESDTPFFGNEETISELKILRGRDAALNIFRLEGDSTIITWAKIYRKSLWIDLRFPVGRIHEDNATTPMAYYKSRYVGFVNKNLYAYRQNPNGITGRKFTRRRFDDSMFALECCQEYFKQREDDQFQLFLKRYCDIIHASCVLEARHARMLGGIPSCYNMSTRKALRILKENLSPQRYVSWIERTCPIVSKVAKISLLLRRIFCFLKA